MNAKALIWTLVCANVVLTAALFGWIGVLAAKVYDSTIIGVGTFVLLVAVMAIGVWDRLRRLRAERAAKSAGTPVSNGDDEAQRTAAGGKPCDSGRPGKGE